MKARPGVTKLGCLFMVLVAVAVAYFGLNAGEVYLRYYRYRDAMVQEARFAHQNSDEVIRRHLRSRADSLGLPEEAGQVKVRRTTRRLTISAEYYETIELPMFVRAVRFAPTISRDL